MTFPRLPNPRTAVVVAGDFSTGVLVGPALYASGFNVIHVRNQTEARAHPVVDPSVFSRVLTFDGDLEAIVAALRAERVHYVIPGMEKGVALADAIADRLGIPYANAAATSAARCDKHAMIEALRAAGVPHVGYGLATSADAAIAWAAQHGRWPIVAKPRLSAGGDGVYICDDADELRARVTSLLGSRTVYATLIDSVLLEEFLDGPEYMVNAVSAHGTHRVRNVLRSEKRRIDGRPVYDHAYLIDPATDEFRELESYTHRVLDALGIRYGASHNEMIRTSRGPILVETGARLQGRLDPSGYVLATGANPLLETVRSYTDPDGFLASTAAGAERRAYYRIVMLSALHAGTMRADLPWAEIEKLPSFHNGSTLGAGAKVAKTCDLFTKIGSVHLIHHDLAQIETDHAWMRRFEAGPLQDLIG